MSSAAKALTLLSHFSVRQPEIGLSELCRIARRDKATTYRHLQALETAGFVEQNPQTKHYRLGPALMQLAHTREATVPRKYSAQAAIAALSEATGETAHVTVLSGDVLYALASCESALHGARAVIDIATFPLHATASGLCALAFGPAQLQDKAVQDMVAFTPNTAKDAQELGKLVEAARNSGFGQSLGTFETDIQSISAPIFDETGAFAGAVSVASVSSRFTPALERTIKTGLITASRDITLAWGGTLPAAVEAAWSRSRPPFPQPETAS